MSSHSPMHIEYNLPAQKILRKMDMLGDQEGIYHRYQNEKAGWDLHCAKTKAFIKGSFEPNQEKTIAVFGSGWMLDVPALFLLNNFKRVDFYDLNHPARIMEHYKSFDNARFIATDLTGGLLHEVYTMSSHWKKPNFDELIEKAVHTELQLFEDTDFRISVNLLNQLDILLVDYIKRFHRIPLHIEQAFRKAIQDNHLQLLPAGKSCLVTDYEEVHLGSKNEVKESFSLLHTNLPKSTITEYWEWIFDTRKTYNPHYKTNLRVTAIKL